jgi:hypothetical protein
MTTFKELMKRVCIELSGQVTILWIAAKNSARTENYYFTEDLPHTGE